MTLKSLLRPLHRLVLLLILSISFNTGFSQISETEPNGTTSTVGTKTVSASSRIVGFVNPGSMSMGEMFNFVFTPADTDVWNIQDGSSGKLTFAILTTGMPPFIQLQEFTLSNRSGMPGSTMLNSGTEVTLDPAKYYSISIMSTEMMFGAGSNYDITMTNEQEEEETENQITLSSADPSSFCLGVESSVSVPYTLEGTFTEGNVFSLYVSTDSEFSTELKVASEVTTNSGTLTLDAEEVVPGTYYLRVKSSSPAVVSNGISFTVNDKPTISAGDDLVICPGETVTLTASGTEDANWGELSEEAAVEVSPEITTEYTAWGSNAEGCSGSDVIKVTVLEPQRDVTPETTSLLCESSAVITVKAAGEEVTYDLINKATEQVVLTQMGTGGDLEFLVHNISETTVFQVRSSLCNTIMETEPVVNVNSITQFFPTAMDASICAESSTTIALNSSQTGYQYYLRNDANDEVVAGPVSGTGGKLLFSSGSLWQTTTFNVLAQNTTNPECAVEMNTKTTVTVNYFPKVYGPSSKVRICENSTATFSVKAEEGVTVRWYGEAESGPVLFTGNEFETPELSENATYYYDATLNGCTTKRRSVYVYVEKPENPYLSLDALCLNDESVQLPEGYSWSGTGVENNTFSPATAGAGSHELSYAFVYGELECEAGFTATVEVMALPEVTAVDAMTVCIEAEPFSLNTGSPAGGSYSGPSVFDGTFDPLSNGAGEYTVIYTFTNEDGCTSTAESKITVKSGIAPTVWASAKSFCEGTSASISAVSGYESYQWFNSNEPVEGAASSSLTVSDAGEYSVSVTDEDGCIAMSETLSLSETANPEPMISYAGSPNFCVNSSITLSTDPMASIQWNRDGEEISGADQTELSASLAGSYTVTITDELGCSGTSSAVSVSGSSPVAVSASGTTDLCPGGSVILSSSPASRYQWFSGESHLSSSQTLTVTQSGTYYVVATDAAGCSATSASMEVTLHSNPVPVLNAPEDLSLCGGEFVKMSTGNGFAGYQWTRNGSNIPGAIYPYLTNYLPGTVSVKVSDEFGCTGISNEVHISVSSPVVTVSPAVKQVVCSNETVSFSATGGLTYQWLYNGLPLAGSNTASLQASLQGNYAVVAVDAQGCFALSTTVSVSHIQAPPVPVVTLMPELVLVSSSSSGNQWFRNNVAIENATSREYKVTENGTYYVEVTGAGNCTEQSEAMTINNVAVAEVNATGIVSVYPNPMTDVLKIEVSLNGEAQLFDLGGRLVMTHPLKAGANQLNATMLSAGTYTLLIRTGSGELTAVKLVK